MDIKEFSCGKCGGKGRLGEYVAVNGGLCYECNGTGKAKFSRNYKIKTTDIVALTEFGFNKRDSLIVLEYMRDGETNLKGTSGKYLEILERMIDCGLMTCEDGYCYTWYLDNKGKVIDWQDYIV